jgi:hypothetical protein
MAVTSFHHLRSLTIAFFIGGDLNQVKSVDTNANDPIVVIYRHVEGIERVTSLAGLPVLDLIARGELPHVAESPPPDSPPKAPVRSTVRTLSGTTILDPHTPEMLAQALGFPYLPLDDVAINPEIGFLILRTAPGKKGHASDGQARTNLLWEIAEDTFHGIPLLTDTADVAARLYGERPKAGPAPQTSPTTPRPRLPSQARRDPTPR